MKFKNAILTTEIKEKKVIHKSYITYEELMSRLPNNEININSVLSDKYDILTLLDDDINIFNIYLKEKYNHRGFLNDLNIKSIFKMLIKNVTFTEISINNNDSDDVLSEQDEEHL